MERVLLAIDVQNDFCPGGALPVPGGAEVVAVINLLAARFRLVAATQDWHPPGHVSFSVWPEHCLAGTAGAAFHPQLDCSRFALILRKGQRPELDSYSAFFENDRRTATGLGGWLRELGVREVFLAGLATDVCVYHSALDALRLGLEVRLVEDACRGIDSPAGSLGQRVAELRRAGVKLLAAGEA